MPYGLGWCVSQVPLVVSQPNGFRLPSCGSSFPKLPLLLADYNKDDSFSVWGVLVPRKHKHTHTHTHTVSKGRGHTIHTTAFPSCKIHVCTSHSVNSRLKLSRPVWWLTDWLGETWVLMDIYISLCFYTGHRIMYDSLGDTETHVNPDPLMGIIPFDFKRTDQMLLTSNTSSQRKELVNVI